MNQPAKAQEPSMEEILASIRRIISDDETTGKAPASPPKPAPAPVRAEAPARPAPKPAAAPAPREVAEIQDDIEAVLAEPEKPAIEEAPASVDAADADILELTEEMAAEPPAPEPAEGNFRTIDGQPDVFFAEEPAEPVRQMPVMDRAPAASHDFDSAQNRSLISQAASAAVDSAFNELAQTVFTQSSHTIEDVVRDMLRPMLKSWLDDNLPGLVERLVRAEIERVSRGRG